MGVVTNFKTARTYFQEAAKGGETDAQRRLGRAYRDGTLGLKADPEVATMWPQKATDGDSEDEEDEKEEEEEEEEHGEEEKDGELELGRGTRRGN